MVCACHSEVDLPSFMATCVNSDKKPDTMLHFFEQHLNRQRVPRRRSALVDSAMDAVASRVAHSLGFDAEDIGER